MREPGREGFTLLEVTVVLALMGLLALLTGPVLARELREDPGEVGVDRVHDALIAARHASVDAGRPARVTPVHAGHALLLGDSIVALPAGVRVRPLDRSAGGGTSAVFYPTGLSSGARWSIERDGEPLARVLLGPLTGSVRIVGEADRERERPDPDGGP